MSTYLHIAIDGPVGAGKSDISSRLASVLGLTYLYTGAMYRALAWVCLTQSIPLDNESRVIMTLKHTTIDLLPQDKESKYPVKVYVNNKEVTRELFTPAIDAAVPIVSKIELVRKDMVKRQQRMAEGRGVVMEGRDIGLRVLPYAQLKIYLTASLEERAKRRWEQIKKKRNDTLLSDVLGETQKRDEEDMTRAVDPLQKLSDAWELDTTGLTQDQVIEKIKDELRNRGLL